MTDARFIRRFVQEAEFLFEDVKEEIKKDCKKEIEGIFVKYPKRQFRKIVKLIDEINKESKKFTISISSMENCEVNIKKKK